MSKSTLGLDEKTADALLQTGIKTAGHSFVKDCPIGARLKIRDRVFAPGAKAPQTRPGELGYDL